MRILVSKWGSVLRCDANTVSRGTGEVGETLALIKYLMRQGHDVTYFGAYEGSLPCPAIRSHIAHLTAPGSVEASLTAEDQYEGWEADEKAMGDNSFDAYLTVTGYSPTWTRIDNPAYASPQLVGVRYCSPILNMYKYLGLPRILINNDPRNYPKEQDISLACGRGMNKTLAPKPDAILDQRIAKHLMIRKVGGVNYKVRTRYAACESWVCELFGEEIEYASIDLPRPIPVGIMSHNHETTGCRQRNRHSAWQDVLTGYTCNDGTPIPTWGAGWTWWNDSGIVDWQGVTKEPFETLRQMRFTPVVGLENFNTSKIFVAAAMGCVPLLYGSGESPYTYDRLGIYQSLSSPWRIHKPGDLQRVLVHIPYDSMIDYWHDQCTPRWDTLDELLGYIEQGGELPNYERFGGYERC